MSCTHPIVRLETNKRIRKVDGTYTYEAKFDYDAANLYDRDFGDWAKALEKKYGSYRKAQLIPCGHCIECRLAYARDKATQLSLEKLNPEYGNAESWFLTLTYDDLHIPTHHTINEETGELFEGTSVNPRDMQLFWKRLRKHYKDKKIRYLNVMEYGEKTGRPHAHAIAFGIPLDQSQFIKRGNNNQGDPIWTSKEINDIWQNGEVIIGEATFQSMSYVARYTMKKIKAQYDDWYYQSQGKRKEWLSMSDDIGKWYYDLHKDEIYKTDTVPIKDNHGNLCKPPKSYDRFYKRDNPKEWKRVQAKREKEAKIAEILKRNQTNKTTQERREAEELNKTKQFKDLRRENNGTS